MRHPLFALMASAGLLACSGGGESDPATTDGQSANNNIPSAGAAVVEEREFANSTSSSALTPPPTIGRPRPGPPEPAPRFRGAAEPDSRGRRQHRRRYSWPARQTSRRPRRSRDGLGPTMNLDSCGGCHAQPAAGGTSPAVNPQVALATQARHDQRVALVHPAERAGARGSLRAQRRWHPRRRRACVVHDQGTRKRARTAASRSRLRGSSWRATT